MSSESSLGVLKKDAVKPAGPRRIGDCAVAGNPISGGPRARIVEQGDGRTVIEVICTCGGSIRLNCEYARAGEADNDVAAGPGGQDERKEKVSSA